LLSFILNIHYY